jgi:hypothetical protein
LKDRTWISVSHSLSLGPICAVGGSKPDCCPRTHPPQQIKKKQDREKSRKEGNMPDINTNIRLLTTCSSVLNKKVLKNCPNKIVLVSRFSVCLSWKKNLGVFLIIYATTLIACTYSCPYFAELMVIALYVTDLARVCWFRSYLFQSACFSVLH